MEFVGLPGAGKSALSRAVADELRSAGLASAEPAAATAGLALAARALRKTALAARAVAASPLGAARWGRALLATDQRNPADYVRVALNWFYIAGLVRGGSSDSGARLFDQGPAQALWSVVYGSGPGRLNRDAAGLVLRTLLPVPTLIVVVRTSEATLAERLRERPGGDSRLERDLVGGEAASAYSRAAAALAWVEELLARLARPGEIEIATVPGEREAELGPAAGDIARRVRLLLDA